MYLLYFLSVILLEIWVYLFMSIKTNMFPNKILMDADMSSIFLRDNLFVLIALYSE